MHNFGSAASRRLAASTRSRVREFHCPLLQALKSFRQGLAVDAKDARFVPPRAIIGMRAPAVVACVLTILKLTGWHVLWRRMPYARVRVCVCACLRSCACACETGCIASEGSVRGDRPRRPICFACSPVPAQSVGDALQAAGVGNEV